MPLPEWIEFDPVDESLLRDFEEAYILADVAGLPEGNSEAARRVALVLQRKRPHALLLNEPGPHWIVGDPENATKPPRSRPR
jgi:hypothetical protein